LDNQEAQIVAEQDYDIDMIYDEGTTSSKMILIVSMVVVFLAAALVGFRFIMNTA
jgi:hypothetical protein|tara:strand:+ start:638 stop:802 length:165 start_codon:yes stop_codon:yes gene_type:complete